MQTGIDGEDAMPEEPVPTGWMDTQMQGATAFRRHYETTRQSYLSANTKMLYRDPVLPPHYDVLTTAGDFARGGMPDVAVIMAQTACEIATEAVLNGLLLLHSFSNPVESWIRDRIDSASTFRRGVLYELYRALSGDNLKGTKLWDELNGPIGIRNAIVHKGDHATEAQAKRYCEIALDLIHHFEGVLARATTTPKT
jgi:hypothetical protein